MKKSILLLVFFAINSVMCLAQTSVDVEKYLTDFNSFVTEISKVSNPSDAQVEVWRADYADFRDRYKSTYKDVMTNEQVEKYYSYCAQFNKAVGRKNLKEAGEAIDTAAVKVGKAVKRGASKVSGVVKGIFKKKDN